jgi:PPOX class probable F420-dependent enzyme
MTGEQARRRFATARVARLATADADARPHLVPMVFVLAGETIYSAVDAKPKRTTALRRLANVAANPRVAVLVDHYDEDWTKLWWVRADGAAQIHDSGDDMAMGYALLRRKYPQYERIALDGPVVTVAVRRFSSWHA